MISLINLIKEMGYHYTGMGNYSDKRKKQRLVKKYDVVIDIVGSKTDRKFKDPDTAIYNVDWEPQDVEREEENEYFNEPYPRAIGEFTMDDGDIQIIDDLFYQISNRKYKNGTRVVFHLFDFQLEQRLLKEDKSILLYKPEMLELYKSMIASGRFMVYIGDYNRETGKNDDMFDTAQAIYIPIHVKPEEGKLGVRNFLFNRRAEMGKNVGLHMGQKLITSLDELEKYITSDYQVFSNQDKISHIYINRKIK